MLVYFINYNDFQRRSMEKTIFSRLWNYSNSLVYLFGVMLCLMLYCRSDGVFVENSVCDSVRIGEYVHFEIEVSLQSCANHLQNQSFLVKSDDLSDNLQVDVEIFCQCDCNDKVF